MNFSRYCADFRRLGIFRVAYFRKFSQIALHIFANRVAYFRKSRCKFLQIACIFSQIVLQIFANRVQIFANICKYLQICAYFDANMQKFANICKNLQRDLQQICKNMQANEQEEMGVPCKNLRKYASQEIQGYGSPMTKFTNATRQGHREATSISALICGQTIPEHNLLKMVADFCTSSATEVDSWSNLRRPDPRIFCPQIRPPRRVV